MAAGANRFGLLERVASAAQATDAYRALVGVFLLGGNDTNDLVVPTDSTNYALYKAARGSLTQPLPGTTYSSTSTTTNPLIALTPGPNNTAAGTYGLHWRMPKLAALFNGTNANVANSRALAFVFNVGPLVQPTPMATYKAILAGTDTTHTLPEHLFSHIDQQNAWASAFPDPQALFSAATLPTSPQSTGWGGRALDRFNSPTSTINPLVNTTPAALPYPVLSYGGVPVFGVGATAPLTIPSNGALSLSSTGSTSINNLRDAALGNILGATMSPVIPMQDAFSASFEATLSYATLRASARSGNALPAAALAPFAAITNNALATQLQHILEDILASASGSTTGLKQKRQIFSAALGGFDTHTSELSQHYTLYGQVDDALDAFYTALDALNKAIAAGQVAGVTAPLKVTLFTMSDFSRTMLANSTGGTDHGWGSHMMVLGDQVKGGAFYGTFPDLTPNTSSNPANWTGANDVGEGRWLPSSSSDQYANTLATWLGLNTSADRNYVFPRLANFSTKVIGGGTTGFMNV
jgi:uncharacterized protein (DUF1501 family)